MSDLEEIFKMLTHKGFLSLKKIVDYSFPTKDHAGSKITDKPWIKIIAYLAPILAIIILFIVYSNPPTFFTIFPHLGKIFHYVVVGYAAFYAFLLFFCSLILKMKSRSSSLLLILTPFAPLKVFLIFCIINFFFAASGFDETAKELTSADEFRANIRQKIQDTRDTLQEGFAKQDTAFNAKYNDTKSKMKSLNEGFNERFNSQTNAFLEHFEKEWEAKARRREAMSKAHEEAMEDFHREFTKRSNDFKKNFMRHDRKAELTEGQKNE